MNKLRKTVDENLSFSLNELEKELFPRKNTGKDIKVQEEDLDNDPEFIADYLKAQFVEGIYKAMEKEKINKKTLAEKLNKSRQYVGRVLNENANFTIETMTSFACALNMKLQIKMTEQSEKLYEKGYINTTKTPVSSSVEYQGENSTANSTNIIKHNFPLKYNNQVIEDIM